MRLQLLPSTFDLEGKLSQRQHLLSIVIDDRVAIDAGSLAMACSDVQRQQVRDIVLTHTHLDHIAGLPLFIDDLFSYLEKPIRIYATRVMIDILERDIFNWSIYPRFSELSNEHGAVVEYIEIDGNSTFSVDHLTVRSVPVNHRVAANGYILSDGSSSVAISGDTAETDEFWQVCNETSDLKAILVECAFPNEMDELAAVSNHLTPKTLKHELAKLDHRETPIYVINLKPMYRDRLIEEINAEQIAGLEILKVGQNYDF